MMEARAKKEGRQMDKTRLAKLRRTFKALCDAVDIESRIPRQIAGIDQDGNVVAAHYIRKLQDVAAYIKILR